MACSLFKVSTEWRNFLLTDVTFDHICDQKSHLSKSLSTGPWQITVTPSHQLTPYPTWAVTLFVLQVKRFLTNPEEKWAWLCVNTASVPFTRCFTHTFHRFSITFLINASGLSEVVRVCELCYNLRFSFPPRSALQSCSDVSPPGSFEGQQPRKGSYKVHSHILGNSIFHSPSQN